VNGVRPERERRRALSILALLIVISGNKTHRDTPLPPSTSTEDTTVTGHFYDQTRIGYNM